MPKECPSCRKQVHDRYSICPFCRHDFGRGGDIDSEPSPPGRSAGGRPSRRPRGKAGRPPSKSGGGFGKFFLGLIIIAIAGFGLYKYLMRLPEFREFKARTLDKAESIRHKKLTGGSKAKASGRLDFDEYIQLPGKPLGLAHSGRGFVTTNKIDPWGFIDVTEGKKGGYGIDKVMVQEQRYMQKVGFNAVTWNGKTFVSYTGGGWFQKHDQMVFVTHDPETLEIQKYFVAPPGLGLGCIAWDGTGYWAATRRNTRDSGEPSFLYRLDNNFNVVEKFNPPAYGCQGLAWDGEYLWWADVFSDEIIMLDVSGRRPEAVHKYRTNFNYLSGIASDGTDIWIAEYDGNRLYRLDPRLRKLWEDGNYSVKHFGMFEGIKQLRDYTDGKIPLSQVLAPLKRGKVELADFPYMMDWLLSYGMGNEVRKLLNDIIESNENETLRQIAARELERIEGGESATESYEGKVSVSIEITGEVPEEFEDSIKALEEELGEEFIRRSDAGVQEHRMAGVQSDDFGGSIGEGSLSDASSYDEYVNSFTSETAENDADVKSFSVELRDDTLYGSWNVYFGSELFEGISTEADDDPYAFPTFAKYRITVSGGSLGEPVVITFDAEPEDNETQDEELASDLGPGSYEVGMFIHVQYKDEDTNRVINKTVPDLNVKK